MPLRLVSLVELDAAGDAGRERQRRAHPRQHRPDGSLAHGCPPVTVSVEVAHGRTIEEAIDGLEWDDGEILIVGSSRLAEKNRLFIGSTANKVLRALPVPMVVVPRDYERVDSAPEA